jgi:CHRD domain
MSRLASWPVLIIVFGFIGLALHGADALAAPQSFTVALTGAQQVPPVLTPGTGTADLTYDLATRVITWSITYSGLSSPATMAHFHGPAGPGKNASVLVWLTKRGAPVSSPITGQATLTPAQAQALLAGQLYINVHTRAHPAGEIRGQVVPPKS